MADMKRLDVRISPRLLAAVRAETDASGDTVSDAVRGFLERWTARPVVPAAEEGMITARIAVLVPPELLAAARSKAAAEGDTVSDAVRRFLERWSASKQ